MELPPPDSDKEARFHRVAEAVIAILLQKGPANLRYAAVARRAGVSRAWIYKHFGKDPDALIEFAVRRFGAVFAELGASRHSDDVATWRGHIVDATHRGLRDTAGAPWAVELFFRYRHAPGALGDGLRDLERRHVEEFAADMPASLRGRRDARAFAEAFTAARLGVFHAWIDPDARGSEDAVVAWVVAMLDAFRGAAGG